MSKENVTVRYGFASQRRPAGRRAMGALPKDTPPAVGAATPQTAAVPVPVPAPPQGHIPRIARLVALAHRFERLLEEGSVESMADLARLGGVTPARITQIMDLLLLAPDIHEALLFLAPVETGHDPIHLREVRYVCQAPAWEEQRRRWAEIMEGQTTPGGRGAHLTPLAFDRHHGRMPERRRPPCPP